MMPLDAQRPPDLRRVQDDQDLTVTRQKANLHHTRYKATTTAVASRGPILTTLRRPSRLSQLGENISPNVTSVTNRGTGAP